MAELYADVAGINGLYNQLTRASDDAADTLSHVHKHCDMPAVDVGYIQYLMGPHTQAYKNLTSALERLQQLTQGSATQINRIQLNYRKTDLESAKALDASHPGAKDAAAVAGALASRRPDLGAARAGFTDLDEPTRVLQNPQYIVPIELWSINPMADLVSPSAWLRQTIIWVFDHDPLQGWASQFSGDWKAYVHCGCAISQAGAAAKLIASNVLSGAAAIPQVWRGNAADEAQEWLLKLGVATSGLAAVCSDYYDLYLQAADAMKKLYDVTAGLITDLIDQLIIISGALAAGAATIQTVFGPIAGFSVASYYAWQAYDLYKQIAMYFGAAEDLLKLIGGSISGLDALLSLERIPEVQPYPQSDR